MYRVTRKQVIKQGMGCDWAVIRCEDSTEFDSYDAADLLRLRLLSSEMSLGGKPYENESVIFETPTLYRSVQVTIEEIIFGDE